MSLNGYDIIVYLFISKEYIARSLEILVMKLQTISNNEYIRNTFAKMQSVEDFVSLLNDVGLQEYGANFKSFKLNQITWYAFPLINSRRYRKFSIKKKNGGVRIIHAPVRGLKNIQTILSIILQAIYCPHSAANGFIQGKSIKDGALLHSGNKFVYNVDLKDFFSSVDRSRVWGRLTVPPFRLSGNVKRKKIADIIAQLCCHEMEVERFINGAWQTVTEHVLPQGAPTSPMLTNSICERMDICLTGAAKRFGLVYSRYADDLSFSSNHNAYKIDGAFIAEMNRIILEQNFHLKSSKTRLQKREYRQEVTGLVVNETPNVPKRYIKELRKWLYLWERYGYSRTAVLFLKAYYKDKGHVKHPNARMENVLDGKLNYLKMVRGSSDPRYIDLKRRYDTLISETISDQLNVNNIPNEVLNDAVLSRKLENYKWQFIARLQKEKRGFKHRPKDVAKLMKLFDEPQSLKDLTHENPDMPYSLDEYLKHSEGLFKNLTSGNDPLYIPQSLYQIIQGFAFSNPPEWFHNKMKIKEGWRSQKWYDWNLTTDMHPLINKDFDMVADSFRKSTRIRINSLHKFMKKTLEDYFGNDFLKLIIDYGNIKNADLYTNADIFSLSLRSLFRNSKDDNFTFPKYRFEYKTREVDGFYERILWITNIDSYSTKPIANMVADIYSGKGNLGTAAQYFFGYCDWSIINKWDDDTYKINILSSSSSHVIEEIDISCDGFTHILKFFQKIE